MEVVKPLLVPFHLKNLLQHFDHDNYNYEPDVIS